MKDIFLNAGEAKTNNRDYQFWQQHNHPVELSNRVITKQHADYIHNNPVEAGFVDNTRDWVYSSARDYEDEKGILDIEFLYQVLDAKTRERCIF